MADDLRADLVARLREVTAELRSYIMSDYSSTRDRAAEGPIAKSAVPAAEALLERIAKEAAE